MKNKRKIKEYQRIMTLNNKSTVSLMNEHFLPTQYGARKHKIKSYDNEDMICLASVNS